MNMEEIALPAGLEPSEREPDLSAFFLNDINAKKVKPF